MDSDIFSPCHHHSRKKQNFSSQCSDRSQRLPTFPHNVFPSSNFPQESVVCSSIPFFRKPTFMISNLLMATGGLLAAFAPEFFTFVACRVLAGFAIAGVEVDADDDDEIKDNDDDDHKNDREDETLKLLVLLLGVQYQHQHHHVIDDNYNDSDASSDL